MEVKVETYEQMKSRHQKEYDEFVTKSIFFAFSNEQFDEGMKKFGLDPKEDLDKIYRINAGGFILKKYSEEYNELTLRMAKEQQEAIDNDKTGEGFIFQMFRYELANHEYCITYDVEDTLDVFGLTEEDIENSEPLKNGLELAKRKYLEDCEKYGWG